MLGRIHGLSTNEGTVKSRYSDEVTTYISDVTLLEKDAKIDALEKQIEELQDALDYFNATTEV